MESLNRLRDDLRLPVNGVAEAYECLTQAGMTIERLAKAIGRDADSELKWWADAFGRQCGRSLAELDQLAPWVKKMESVPGVNPASCGKHCGS